MCSVCKHNCYTQKNLHTKQLLGSKQSDFVKQFNLIIHHSIPNNMSKSKHNFQGKECFSRMNFLYQASQLMAGKNNTLSLYYGELCKNIGKKAVLRIDPNVKRDFCKRCSLAQKPGVTCDLKIKSQRRKRKKQEMIEQLDQNVQVQISCQLCGQNKNFNVTDEYKFWLENPESVAEVCTINFPEKQRDNNVNNKEEENKNAKA